MTDRPLHAHPVRDPRADRGAILDAVGERARSSGLFGEVARLGSGVLSLSAPDAGAPAFYRVSLAGAGGEGGVFVSLVTPDRYLSQSIEQDLVHTGDKLSDLLHDELIDADHPSPWRPVVEHFRDAEKLYTFRTAVPEAELSLGGDGPVLRVWLLLKAYRACFENLGDMSAGDEE